MRIEGINGTNMQNVGINRQMGTDSVSKNIQNQIANAQKQLQELSSNKEMSIEEKMNKRQEIQQQIADLNNQLRQHQIEMRREQQQTKSSSMDEMLGGSRKVSNTRNQGTGFSQDSMQAIISADSAITQVQSSGCVVTKMEGRAGVLETEIKLDSARGNNVEAKQEELDEVQQKASQAQASQMNVLANANKELDEAAKSEQKTEHNKVIIDDESTENKVNGHQNPTTKTNGYKNVREYSKYLMDKYSCLIPGNNVAVTVTSGMLKKAMTDKKTGKWLERELSKAPDYIKQAQQAASARGSKLLSCTIEFGEEYTTMCTLTVTDTPGTDEDIDKWLERIEEKKEEKKATERRLEKQRLENTFIGKDLKSVTDSFIQSLSTINSSIILLCGFDMKV